MEDQPDRASQWPRALIDPGDNRRLEFTYETYAPPVVKIVPGTVTTMPAFSQHKLLDRYPGIFDPGNIYVQIEDLFPGVVTVVGPSGRTNLKEGETAEKLR